MNILASVSRIKDDVNISTRKSKNYKYRKLKFTDVVKSPYVFRCKNNNHVWKKVSQSDRILRFSNKLNEAFQCLLCYAWVELDILDEETSRNIRDSIADRVGVDVFTLEIADSILERFYKNQNEPYRSDDFKFPESLKNFRKGYSEEVFKQDRNKIIEVLVEYKIIEKHISGKYAFVRKSY